MKQIAILLTSTGWGGLEMNIAKLGRLLIDLGWKITLITTESAVAHKKEKGFYTELHTIRPVKKYLDITSAKRIAKILKSTGNNTLFIGYSKDIALASMAKKLFYKDLKIVYQQQMQIGLNKKDPVHTLRHKSINRWITPLPWLKNEILERTHFPQERIQIIPLGADVDKLVTPKYTKEEARKELGINITSTLIGIIGRIDPDKGQKFLVESVTPLRQQGMDVQLLVFGSPTVNSEWSQGYYDELLAVVNTNALNDVVHFKGHSKDVQLFYNAVDIFTMSSKIETYGMVTVEAMASGVLVIGANTGGTPELLKNGELGLVYEYNNTQDYCDKVKWAISNPDEVNKLTTKARVVASASYSQMAEAKQIDKLLLEL